MKDFRIVARIYNNQLRERREATGLSACAFAGKIGISPTDYCALETMKLAPITSGVGSFGKSVPRRWRRIAQIIAGALGVEPAVLWPDSVLEIKKTVSEVRVDADDIAAMLPPAESSPFLLLSAAEESRVLSDALTELDTRERLVVERHLAGETFKEIASDLGVTRERARQIEATAIRRLRANKSVKALRAE